MNEIAKETLLFDFYGSLLTEKKRRVMELYHEEDLSLAEIAEEFGISRAAVHDSLKSAERQLAEYEDKLGMVARLTGAQKDWNQVHQIMDEMERLCGENTQQNRQLSNRLAELKEALQDLERA